jgi:hypothetical protein
MRYLRFSPDEYRVMRRLVRTTPLGEMDLPAVKRFLVANLPLDRLDLAMRIDRLEDGQMQLLYEHLVGHKPAGAMRGGWDAFTEGELETVAYAWGSFPYPVRFLRHFRKPLVHLLSDGSPDLAQKLAGLSERQFRLLYEHVRGRREGSA